jgi:hypothetical protein
LQTKAALTLTGWRGFQYSLRSSNIMNYRGFEVRETRAGIWQAITATALHWEDGLQAPDRFALKTAIDAYRDNQRSNPWELPSVVQEVAIAA